MTNEKIKEILDRCNGRFGWVQIHIDTEENYLLMPLTDLVELLEKQIPKKPILEKTKGIVGVDMWHCPVCKDEIISDWNRDIANPYCHHCGQRLDWRAEDEA